MCFQAAVDGELTLKVRNRAEHTIYLITCQVFGIEFLFSLFQFLTLYLMPNDVVVVQSLSPARLFATPWTAARQASLPFTISRSLLKLMCIELVMPSNHLVLCHSLLPPSIFPSIRVFSNESVLCIRWPKSWSISFSISPFSEYSELIFFRIDWFDLLAV